jgi:GH24 family phage-related lysozyme (muramidase)
MCSIVYLSSVPFKAHTEKVVVKKEENHELYSTLCFLIKSTEGYSDEVYKCPAGVKTRGWGITKVEIVELNKKLGTNYKWRDLNNIHTNNKIIKDCIQYRYNKIIEEYPFLDKSTTYGLVSFTYNLGMGKLRDKSIKKALNHLKNTGDKSKLINAMNKYVYVNNRKSKGLIKRRILETKLIANKLSKQESHNLKKDVLLHMNNKN